VSDSATRLSILAALQQDPNDAEAWRKIVARYGRRIFGWARGRGLQPPDCEDVTQQVLVRLSGVLRTFKYDSKKGRFRDYLRTITQNAVVDFLRRNGRRPRGTGSDAIARALDSEEARTDLWHRLAQEYDLELFEMACLGVRERVGNEVWERFWLTIPLGVGGGGESPDGAARRLGVLVGLIYQARHKTLPLLSEEVERLGGRNLVD
jgi:RNA polymerase sigma factor (sigma-70 family)